MLNKAAALALLLTLCLCHEQALGYKDRLGSGLAAKARYTGPSSAWGRFRRFLAAAEYNDDEYSDMYGLDDFAQADEPGGWG